MRKLWKGTLPASLSRGTECSVFCITCPAPRKRGSSRCVLHLLILYTISLRSKPAAKALLLSPAQLRGVVSLMQPRPPVWPGALGMCKRAACRQAVNGHCFFRISLFLSAKLLSAFRPARSLKRKPFYPHGTAAERRFDKRKSRKDDDISSSFRLFRGWASWIRTSAMTESKSVALPLGDGPVRQERPTLADSPFL